MSCLWSKVNKDWMPEFDYTETIEGIAPFRGSKYVQAIVGNAYKKTEEFLKLGREVLFSGTPCQVAGLKRFLRKEYDNLLIVDIICHGVPSPKVWNMYLEETCTKLLRSVSGGKKYLLGDKYKFCIETVSFRSKISGWKRFSFLLKLNLPDNDGDNPIVLAETLDKNCFMRAFLHDTILRPSCHSCPTKQGKSHSDISIADYWGINHVDPEFDDDKGCGLILLNTEKGCSAYNQLDLISKENLFEEAIRYNSAYSRSSKPHPKRDVFFRIIEKKGIHKSTYICTNIPLYKRIIKRILRTIK